MVSLAQASDLVENERDVQLRRAHRQAMCQAIEQGESGHIPDSTDIRELHAALFPYGGEWRTCNAIIKGSPHVPPPPERLPILMFEFAEDCRWWLTSSKENDYIKLAHLHLEITKIHAFPDGNGRLARLLLNSHAAYLGVPFIKIDDRDRYIDLLQAEDEAGLAELFKESSIQ